MENELVIRLNQPLIDRLVKISDGDCDVIVEKASEFARNTLAELMVEHIHEKTTERVLNVIADEVSKQVVFRLRREIAKASKEATEIMLNELTTKRKIKSAVKKIVVHSSGSLPSGDFIASDLC